jgi:hypothetical protein
MYTAFSLTAVESSVSPPVNDDQVGCWPGPVASLSQREAVSQSVEMNGPPLVTITK